MAKDISNLVKLLFKTNALEVCPEGEPFWYTSGTIGPYYVNTHYLYGSKEKAEELLQFIDGVKGKKADMSELVFEKVLNNYDEDNVFAEVIDTLVQAIRRNENLDAIDYISGGERRDWFFSFIVAYILKKPHITIFKDLDIMVWDSTSKKQFPISEGEQIKDKKVLHIADLVTEASSYERAWIPALKNIGAVMASTYVIIDRMQGGKELLEKNEIELNSLVNIDISLFNKGRELGLINNEQLDMLKEYLANPHNAMKSFLEKNPRFLEKELQSNGKNKERAELCIKNNIYA